MCSHSDCRTRPPSFSTASQPPQNSRNSSKFNTSVEPSSFGSHSTNTLTAFTMNPRNNRLTLIFENGRLFRPTGDWCKCVLTSGGELASKTRDERRWRTEIWRRRSKNPQRAETSEKRRQRPKESARSHICQSLCERHLARRRRRFVRRNDAHLVKSAILGFVWLVTSALELRVITTSIGSALFILPKRQWQSCWSSTRGSLIPSN